MGRPGGLDDSGEAVFNWIGLIDEDLPSSGAAKFSLQHPYGSNRKYTHGTSNEKWLLGFEKSGDLRKNVSNQKWGEIFEEK